MTEGQLGGHPEDEDLDHPPKDPEERKHLLPNEVMAEMEIQAEEKLPEFFRNLQKKEEAQVDRPSPLDALDDEMRDLIVSEYQEFNEVTNDNKQIIHRLQEITTGDQLKKLRHIAELQEGLSLELVDAADEFSVGNIDDEDLAKHLQDIIAVAEYFQRQLGLFEEPEAPDAKST